MDPNNQHYRSSQPGIKICEAVDCCEAATKTVVVSAGTFGTITLNLCRKCAVTKFRSVPIESGLYEPKEVTECAK